MKSLLEDLKKNISGDVIPFDKGQISYETDESIFRISPQVIVCPKNNQDVQSVIQMATQHSISITARGGGSGIAGQSIGSGIILDFSKYMNRILNISEKEAIVEPGVILTTLNNELYKTKKIFAPDPGSKNYCTLGGMIANNAAGPHALIHGSTRNHVNTMRIAQSDGQTYETHDLPEQYASLIEEVQKNESLIERSKRNVEKNSSGYHVESLLGSKPNFTKFMVGSEGTLGLVVEATLALTPLSEKTYFGVFGFASMPEAVKEVINLRETKPSCIELLDGNILQLMNKVSPSLIQELKLQHAKSALWVEWNHAPSADIQKQTLFFTDGIPTIQKIWAERSLVSKNLHKEAEKQHRKPLRCIEDACVPIAALTGYTNALTKILRKHDAEGAIFGHIGSGHLHVNPNIRTDIPKLQERIDLLMDDFYDLVLKVGGTISGEHGDGILRIKYAKKQWKDLWPLFETIKNQFDPHSIFNPDKKVSIKTTLQPKLKY